MKKIFYYLLLTSLPLTISSCGETPTEQPSENPTMAARQSAVPHVHPLGNDWFRA